jgi:hypothetical protein
MRWSSQANRYEIIAPQCELARAHRKAGATLAVRVGTLSDQEACAGDRTVSRRPGLVRGRNSSVRVSSSSDRAVRSKRAALLRRLVVAFGGLRRRWL